MVRVIAIALFAGLGVGCAATPQLTPVAGSQPAPPGPGRGASDTVEGVTVVARSQAWTGFPRQLDRVTPVQVTVENTSDFPLRVRYDQFALVGPVERYRAIPPFDIRGREVERVRDYVRSPYAARPFAPYRPFRARRGFYDPYDPFYRPFADPAFIDVELPTGDMIQKSLPEDVLMPGDRVTGFLYFENVDRDVARVDFRMDLVDADTNQPRGTISIPFGVR
jgi:hypothetical protein